MNNSPQNTKRRLLEQHSYEKTLIGSFGKFCSESITLVLEIDTISSLTKVTMLTKTYACKYKALCQPSYLQTTKSSSVNPCTCKV